MLLFMVLPLLTFDPCSWFATDEAKDPLCRSSGEYALGARPPQQWNGIMQAKSCRAAMRPSLRGSLIHSSGRVYDFGGQIGQGTGFAPALRQLLLHLPGGRRKLVCRQRYLTELGLRRGAKLQFGGDYDLNCAPPQTCPGKALRHRHK